MILTMKELSALGKVLDDARRDATGGRKAPRPLFKKPHPQAGEPDPDYEVFEGTGHYCLEPFKTLPTGDPPSVHGRSQLGINPENGEVRCAACERSL